MEEVAEAAATVPGFHAWLWKMRLTQARAEIALARQRWEAAGAVQTAWTLGDPALFLAVASASLALEEASLAEEARQTVQRIASALPGQELRRAFRSGLALLEGAP